jgi:hypothetical protein
MAAAYEDIWSGLQCSRTHCLCVLPVEALERLLGHGVKAEEMTCGGQ